MWTSEKAQEVSTRRFALDGDITVIVNREGHFCFSTDHCQEMDEGWVPISSSLPQQVAPRPSLPDGVIYTLEQYIMIYHGDDKEVPNPDPRYQPSWRPFPVRS